MASVSFGDDVEQLKQKLAAAENEVERLQASVEKLQQELQKPVAPTRAAAAEPSMDVAPINEADVTLRRLVQRIAMILQSEKIVIMFYDPRAWGAHRDPPQLRRG